jgi:predicted Fe-Mo cluster-binding NifX family protein
MRLAITTENDLVSAHFGQCSHFTIVDIEDTKVKNKKIITNTAEHGGGGCVAVDEILKHNITHVISGGMGMGAQQKFAAAGVAIYGYTGKIDDAIHDFLNNQIGSLQSCKNHGDCH